jgi:SagB-type dehydrogenase family enzyme
MIKENENILPGLYRVLRDNIRLSRRQACQVGVAMGLSFSTLLTFRLNKVFAKAKETVNREKKAMDLMQPVFDGNMSLEKAIKQRRTVRSFSNKPISSQQFSQILWSAQGITDDREFKRAAPSGGALYPSDVYAVVGENCVETFTPGVYHYNPSSHSVSMVAGGDRRKDVARASLRQMWMADAPVIFVVTAEYDRICTKYGKRGIRYALIEMGHIGQNVFLQSQALGLEAGIVGAFNDRAVADVVEAEKNHEPLVILPVGWKG